ncbi:MAG: DUF6323 family protein [Clostridiales bacterium]|nr:DUF6323 family protein [Clostridiales bacterium]
MDKKDFLEAVSNHSLQVQPLLECNEYTKKFGLSLTQQEALILLDDRKKCLQEQERVEFGEGILKKLIFAFCDSPYIYQDNYVETISSLQDIFYLYKNEAMDELNDDELIDYMVEAFNQDCQGSLEYLEDTSLEKLARKVRRGGHGFMSQRNEEFEDE